MNAPARLQDNFYPLGLGAYTAPEVGRLLRTSSRNVRRWLSGYSYRQDGELRRVEPLWRSQLADLEDDLEVGFRDLIELRFVKAFLDAGLGLKTIRNCLATARSVVEDDRPLSTRRFRTDGRTIFLESIEEGGESSLLDLKKQQYAFEKIVDRTFRDLDLEDDIVVRWRPLRWKGAVTLDPKRSFGQPIVSEAGVPTAVLADAVEAEGSLERVAHLFDVPPQAVRDALSFERSLRAA